MILACRYLYVKRSDAAESEAAVVAVAAECKNRSARMFKSMRDNTTEFKRKLNRVNNDDYDDGA